MKRWNIKSIHLYSHDERRKDLEFNLEDVTIITGDSRTGKSAIPEIIDYVMGSSECHIPSYVRSCLSWVGIVWKKDITEFALFRRVPKMGRKSNSDVYFDIGSNPHIPVKASELRKKTNLEGGLAQFERLLGIGDVQSENFNENLSSKRISVRNTVPYLIQDDDVIISKNSLLRGTNEFDKKQSIIESMPYFFGVIDEQTLDKEIELKRILKAISRLEKKRNADENILYSESNKSINLINEAAQVGLCAPVDLYEKHFESDLYKKLRAILNWDLNSAAQVNEDRLPSLYELLSEEQNKVIELKNKLRSAQRKLLGINNFDDTVNKQQRKLEVINIFKQPHDPAVCPLCSSELEDPSQPVTMINKLINNVHMDLQGIEKDRPRIDNYINKLKKQIEDSKLKIDNYKEEISTLVKEDEQVEKGLDIIQRRYRTIGRISLYLESLDNSTEEELDKDQLMLERLKNKASELEQDVDVDKKIEALENVERRLSSIATEIISKLPFEDRYRNNPIFMAMRNLNVGVSLSTHSESMRDVGSDENYLSLHVSLILAMHRHFSELSRPVPGVIVFDQLSRPYFPPDKEPEEVEVDNERSSLLRYFETIFEEVDKQDSLQIIILEHAYFKSHDRYKKAVKYRWKKNQNGLIPNDWPEKR
ncbi:DUF3732 domain-containing protein [Priestia aryabhattai]|uniref:DUF3732 domain-containing protein n=1 Tax=Priestia aryabhattai TaxID=412384 RepID=UPI00203D6BA2|nr:DUF3732 domain-containing protein [Priestia aryabhattai]MCM2978990.1 DUF3732 domain-containing protein [Priestia aryabhattai]